MNPATSSNFTRIPEIQDGTNLIKDPLIISTVLIYDFFSPLLLCINKLTPPIVAAVQATQLPYEALTREEV